MRRRVGSLRLRSMARPRGDRSRSLDLSPRARTLAGWVVALLLVLGIAVIVGLVGGDDGAPAAGAQPSASVPEATPAAITFGTALAPDGSVAADAVTDRFEPSDTFAYSVAATVPPSAVAYVEVVRIGGGPQEPVQTPAGQPIPEGRTVVGFQVPVQALLTDFGPGEYVMRIYLEPGEAPIGEGRFVLLPVPAAS